MNSPSRRRTVVSPRQASITGIAFMAAGAWLIFVGTGVPHIAPAKDVPLWMVALCGVAFMCAGGAMFIRYRYLGALPSGEGPDMAGSPFARSIQLGLAQAAVGCLCAMCAWVAFGPGPRHFRTRSSIPFIGSPGEHSGRIGFGVAAILLAAMFVAQLVDAWRAPRR